MRKIFHAYPEVTIVTLAVSFLVVLFVCYLWAINVIYAEMHQALTSSSPQSANAFNLAGAAQLDLRGLPVSASSTSVASSSAASGMQVLDVVTGSSTAPTSSSVAAPASNSAPAPLRRSSSGGSRG